MVQIKCAVEGRNMQADGIIASLAEAAVILVDDMIQQQVECVRGGLAVRLYYDVYFLREVLRPAMSKRAEARVKLLHLQLVTDNPSFDKVQMAQWLEQDVNAHSTLLSCFR